MKTVNFILVSATCATMAYVAGNIVSGFMGGPSEDIPILGQVSELAPEIVPVSVAGPDGTIRSVGFAKTEVTFGDWSKCVASGACTFVPRMRTGSEESHPVSGISWLDAQTYIRWISATTGQTYRLPKESEWRTAAIDVLDVEVTKLFDDPRMAWAADYANFEKRADRATKPAGHFGIASNGVADLAGNVWEWTDTCWRSVDAVPETEAIDNCGGVRVLAGAHMTYQSELIRVVPTGGCSIGFPPANIGFRLVIDNPNLTFVAVEATSQANDGT